MFPLQEINREEEEGPLPSLDLLLDGGESSPSPEFGGKNPGLRRVLAGERQRRVGHRRRPTPHRCLEAARSVLEVAGSPVQSFKLGFEYDPFDKP